MLLCSCCNILSSSTRRQLAQQFAQSDAERLSLQTSYVITEKLRSVREAVRHSLVVEASSLASVAPAVLPPRVPSVELFDAQHYQTLPGRIIADPAAPGDLAANTVFSATTGVESFYRTLFGRNSVDGEGADLVSTVRYGVQYQNAFWNGQQMIYGDGDGQILVDFWRSPDVIGHELTHGVTQHESGLLYQGESGALNESISDAFGAVFNQWTNNWDVTAPDAWLIGKGIMGPRAIAGGRTTLRDMSNPGAAYCLTPQPANYAQFDPAGDVHINSGIANKAFHDFAVAVGGNAYGVAIKVWYEAATGGSLHSTATFKDFKALAVAAANTIGGAALANQADAAWSGVGVL
jgi:Zn-dependent metalloprotease